MNFIFKISVITFAYLLSQHITFASLLQDQDNEQARPCSKRQMLEGRIQNYEQQLLVLSTSSGQKRIVAAKRQHINAMIMGLNADLKKLPKDAIVVPLPQPVQSQPEPVIEPQPLPEPEQVIELAPHPVPQPQPDIDPELEHIVQHGRESDSESDSDSDSEIDCTPPPSTPTPELAVEPVIDPLPNASIIPVPQKMLQPSQEFGWRSSAFKNLRTLAEATVSCVKAHPRATLFGVASATVLVYSKYSTGSWLGLMENWVDRIRKRITGEETKRISTQPSFVPVMNPANPGHVFEPVVGSSIRGEPPVVEGFPNGIPIGYESFYSNKSAHMPPSVIRGEPPVVEGLPRGGVPIPGYDPFGVGNVPSGSGSAGGSVGSIPLSIPSGSGGVPGGSLPGNSSLPDLGQSTGGSAGCVIKALVENVAPVVAASSSVVSGLQSLGGKQFTITPSAPDGSFLPSFNIITWKVNFGVAYFDAPKLLKKLIKKAGEPGYRIVAVLEGTNIKLKIVDAAGKVLDKLKLTTEAYKRA